MADASSKYAIRTITVPTDEWTPITAPIACDYLCLWTTAAASIRSDKDDPATEKDLYAASQEVILAPIGVWLSAPPRFKAGDVLFYVKAKDVASKLALTFIY